MSEADKLRRLLDERGVEWRGGLPTETIVTDPIDVLYVQRTDGMIHVYVRSYLTPAQAIEATLGRECHDKNGFDPNLGFECVECGTTVDAYMCSEYAGVQEQFRYCPGCGARVVTL